MPPRLTTRSSGTTISHSPDPTLRGSNKSSSSPKPKTISQDRTMSLSSLPFSMSSLHILVVALLAMVVAAASSSSSFSPRSPPPPVSCTPLDQPNPIASVYPLNVTGLFNATLAIVPIPLATARALVPRQWPILEHVYRALFASLGVSAAAFPPGYYPLFVQAGFDHDIQLGSLNVSITDFQRAGYEFPFVDRLGDNHTSFRWVPHQIITASNTDAIEGSRAYGTEVTPGDVFVPPCDAYEGEGKGKGEEGTHFKASGGSGLRTTSMTLDFHTCPEGGSAAAAPLPLDLFRNVTNQPSFANGTACDNQIRLFDSTFFFAGTGTGKNPFAPRPVQGAVRSVNFGPLDGVQAFVAGVYGWQVATPFIENNLLDCASFQGYDGVDLPGY